MTIAVANTSNTSTFAYWLARTNDMANALSTKVITVDSNATTGNAIVNGTFQANTLVVDTVMANGSLITVSSNVIYSDILTVGNATDNTVINATSVAAPTIVVGGAITGNATTLGIGANTRLTATSLSLSNASSNLVMSSTTGFSVGNTGANVSITPTSVSVSNSVSNVTITPNSILLNGSSVVVDINNGNTNITSSTTVVDSVSKALYRGADYVVTIKNNSANGYQMSRLMILQDDSSTDCQLNEYGLLISNSQLGVFTANANATHARLYLTLNASVTNVQIKSIRFPIPV